MIRQTFQTFLKSSVAPEPLQIANYLVLCQATGRTPYFRVEMAAE